MCVEIWLIFEGFKAIQVNIDLLMLLLILLAILSDIFIFRNCDNIDIRGRIWDQYGREEKGRGEKNESRT